MTTAESFKCSETELGKADLLGQLRVNINPDDQRAGLKTWTVAFAPDHSYFAWSKGHRMVKLIPLRRLPLYLESNAAEANNNNNNNGEGANEVNGQHNGHRAAPHIDLKACGEKDIDCGDLCWSVAFGCDILGRRRKSRANPHWSRFQTRCPLILATGLACGKIKTWDVEKGEILHFLIDHKDTVRDLKFAPDGSLTLVSASLDASLKVWDLKDDGNMVASLKGHQNSIYSCTWSHNTEMLASVGMERMVLLWSMETYKLLGRLEGHNNDVVACSFSPDDAVLATASWDTKVLLWDPYTQEKLYELLHMIPPPRPIFASGANSNWVRGCSFSKNGFYLASIADDKYVRFWPLTQCDVPEKIAKVPNGLCCRYSPDGSVLACGTRNGSVYFIQAPIQVHTLKNICRQAIRRNLPTQQIDKLEIPPKLRRFLSYKNL